MEGSGSRSMKLLEGKMPGMPSPPSVSTKLQKIAELAKEVPENLRGFLDQRVRDGVLPTRSEIVDRGAGCGSSARPDLWEPRGGNNPGPPGAIEHPYCGPDPRTSV